MAGLGLMNAVQGYQQGVQWKQTQDKLAKQQEMQAKLEEANQAGAAEMERSQQEWAASGAPGQYKPSSETMFRVAEARGAALAKAGLIDQYMENAAKVAPMKIKARQEALQQYEIDGDADKLARSVYPTLFDGKRIVGSEMVEGADAVQGLPARPSKLKLKLSDGTTKDIDPQAFVTSLKKSMIDPATTAKNEARLELERTLAGIQADKQIAVEREKTKGGKELATLKAEQTAGLDSANNAAAAERTQTSANATRYSADQRVKAAGLSAGRSGGAPRGEDGLTPTERTNQRRAESVDSRAAIGDLRKQITETRKLLSEATDADSRKELQGELQTLQKELADEQQAFKSSRGRAEQPKAGASPSGMEAARAEAVSSGKPVEFDLGGKRGTISPTGGLADAAPAKGAAKSKPGPGGVYEPKNKAEYDALPPGAVYRKDGKLLRKKAA